MSRTRLTIALSLSIALILSASWFRFGRTLPEVAQLIPVQPVKTSPYQENSLVVDSVSNATSSPSIPLTQTESVSKQLFSEYMALSSSGQVNSKTLENLASQYADGILQDSPYPRATMDNILITSNTEENLAYYGQSVSAIYKKYKSMTQGLKVDPISEGTNPASIESFMEMIANFYNSSANELMAIRVPLMLAPVHLALINNYLENAEAMKAMGNLTDDPIRAYAALNTQAKNTKEEENILLNIQKTMMANGVNFGTGL